LIDGGKNKLAPMMETGTWFVNILLTFFTIYYNLIIISLQILILMIHHLETTRNKNGDFESRNKNGDFDERSVPSSQIFVFRSGWQVHRPNDNS
jgi:hypothetical protein